MGEVIRTFASIEQIQNQYLSKKTMAEQKNADSVSFQDVLRQKSEMNKEQASKLTFSKHANERLASRNISLSNEQVERLSEGVLEARKKGIKESLVMMDNLSFIVNVKNDTVVTALDSNNGEQHVFTNIDGAVIV